MAIFSIFYSKFDGMNHPFTMHRAFAHTIKLRGIDTQLGLKPSKVKSWRRKINQFPDDPTKWNVSQDQIDVTIALARYYSVTEKLWRFVRN